MIKLETCIWYCIYMSSLFMARKKLAIKLKWMGGCLVRFGRVCEWFCKNMRNGLVYPFIWKIMECFYLFFTSLIKSINPEFITSSVNFYLILHFLFSLDLSCTIHIHFHKNIMWPVLLTLLRLTYNPTFYLGLKGRH